MSDLYSTLYWRDKLEGYRGTDIGDEVGWDFAEVLARYVVDGVNPGGFLRAVLENDLQMAYGRADYTSMKCLPNLVKVVYNVLPSQCHGSVEHVRTWRGMREDQHESPSV